MMFCDSFEGRRVLQPARLPIEVKMLCDDLGAGGPFNSSKRWALLGSNQPPPAPINIGGITCSYLSLKFSQSMYAPGEEFVGPAGVEPHTTSPEKYTASD